MAEKLVKDMSEKEIDEMMEDISENVADFLDFVSEHHPTRFQVKFVQYVEEKYSVKNYEMIWKFIQFFQETFPRIPLNDEYADQWFRRVINEEHEEHLDCTARSIFYKYFDHTRITFTARFKDSKHLRGGIGGDLSTIPVAFRFKPLEKIKQGDYMSKKLVNVIHWDLEAIRGKIDYSKEIFKTGGEYQITGYFYMNKYGTKYYFKTERID